jgi:hypothetical protein
MEADRTPNGVVVLYSSDERLYACEHERATRTGIARRLATLKDFEFGVRTRKCAECPARANGWATQVDDSDVPWLSGHLGSVCRTVGHP